MGKRRGEDAGINMQARKEDVEADASRDGKDDGSNTQSALRRQDNSIGEPRQRRKLKPRANNSDKPRPALTNPFGSLNLVPSAAAPKLSFGGSSASSSSSSTPTFGFGGSNKPAASSDLSAKNLKVAALNSSFSKWVQKQMRERPTELWITGFEDYLAHVAKLKAEFANGSGSENGTNGFTSTATQQPFPSSSSSNMFGSKTSPPSKPQPAFSNVGQGSENKAPARFGASSSSSSSAPVPSLFGSSPATKSPAPAASKSNSLFGGSPNAPASTPSPPLFGGTPAAPSSSLFGGPSTTPSSGSSSLFGGPSTKSGSLFGTPASTTPAAPVSGSLFGGPATGGSLFGAPLGGATGVSLFGAPLGGAATGGAAAAAADDDDGDEGGANEPTEVVEKNEDADEDTLFEVLKCKVLWQIDGGAWDKTPTGRLVILRNKKNDSRRIVVRGEGTGKPVFNAPLTHTTQLNKAAKSVTIAAINYRTVNGKLIGDEKPRVYQIKVKSDLISTLFERIQSALPAAK